MLSRTLAVVATLALGFTSCRSDQEKLTASKVELRDLEDALYAQYGGSDLATAVEQQARAGAQEADRKGGADSLAALAGQLIGNVARETDKELFLKDCDLLGRGERPSLLTDKGRAFFDRPETRQQCARAVELRSAIAQLEQKLGVQRQAPAGAPGAR